ncbi:hypothetical protein PV10_08169 [Exophiala mesophila]|uniref:DUF1763-domain-containing protein n=1 Tax=Exophiala mesophila TaxID=212818 RepID=A0A0D1Z131_EXOME|nr:uncharacterized protein PV10_08169 [Exophiala mesophila]KIV88487.1 hypothetical protein PV10_08169 [Exophiala mesophila]
MSRQDIIHAYRNLHKATLKAICYSKPASHTARSILNDTFKKRPQDDFDAIRIQNTLKFLQAAADYAGYEHKILKNLLYVKWWQSRESKRTITSSSNSDFARHIREQSTLQYSATLTMLNESLGTCLTI